MPLHHVQEGNLAGISSYHSASVAENWSIHFSVMAWRLRYMTGWNVSSTRTRCIPHRGPSSTYGSGDCGEVQHELNYPHFILLHFEGSEASWNFFLSRRQDPSESHGRQGVLLHAAAASGHTTITRLLPEHSADANSWNMNAVIPLYRAAKHGNLEIMQLVLSRGVVVITLDG